MKNTITLIVLSIIVLGLLVGWLGTAIPTASTNPGAFIGIGVFSLLFAVILAGPLIASLKSGTPRITNMNRKQAEIERQNAILYQKAKDAAAIMAIKRRPGSK